MRTFCHLVAVLLGAALLALPAAPATADPTNTPTPTTPTDARTPIPSGEAVRSVAPAASSAGNSPSVADPPASQDAPSTPRTRAAAAGTASISGFVWEDDSDGSLEPGEPMLPGVTVGLAPSGSPNGQFRYQTTTASDGTYRFDGLPEDRYLLWFKPPQGMRSSRMADGDPSVTTWGSLGTIDITEPGQQLTDINDAFWRPGVVTVTKTVSHDGPVEVGDTLRYTITVTNQGPGAYNSFSSYIVDDLAGALDNARVNDDARVSAGYISASGHQIGWILPLEVGESATLSYSMTVTSRGDGRVGNLAWADFIEDKEYVPPENCAPPGCSQTVTRIVSGQHPAPSPRTSTSVEADPAKIDPAGGDPASPEPSGSTLAVTGSPDLTWWLLAGSALLGAGMLLIRRGQPRR